MLNVARNPTADHEQNLLEDVNNDGSDYVNLANTNMPNNIGLLDSNRNLNNSTLNINYSNNANHQNPKLRKSKFDIYLPNI